MENPKDLWVPFDNVFHIKEETARLREIFSSHPTSIFSQALRKLGLSPCKTPIFDFIEGVPHLNWTAIVEKISGQTIHLELVDQNKFKARTRINPVYFFRLLKIQWGIEKFIEQNLDGPKETESDPLLLSLSLGLCGVYLMLKIPKRSENEIGTWLFIPEKAPRHLRNTLNVIHKIQVKRTQLSPRWLELFPSEIPDIQGPSTSRNGIIRGVTVFPGIAQGRFEIFKNFEQNPEPQIDKKILIFPAAAPQAVQFYPMASGIIFERGGVLSHACIMAREYKIPSVTNIGKLNQLNEFSEIFLDANSGIIKLLK